jgi:ribonuclease-3
MSKKIPPIINQDILIQALTHRSYKNEHLTTKSDNERLEFLGDAILCFVVAEIIYKRYPEMNEAQLTRLRSKLVDEQQLSQFARELGLPKLMYLGKGAEKDGGRDNPAMLSDTFEAVIAAYFIESGIDAVRHYVQSLFVPVIDEILLSESDINPTNLVDSKNQLQQWSLANFGEKPEYLVIAESGPPHAREFTSQVTVKGLVYGVGKGKKKQDAEKQAAVAALRKLKTSN